MFVVLKQLKIRIKLSFLLTARDQRSATKNITRNTGAYSVTVKLEGNDKRGRMIRLHGSLRFNL